MRTSKTKEFNKKVEKLLFTTALIQFKQLSVPKLYFKQKSRTVLFEV